MIKLARLGKYQVWELLGKGAMGVVYKGFDPGIERVVALKTLRADLTDEHTAGVAARFRNEAKAAGRLNHPGIVAVYDFGEDQGVAFIAMEFVEGRSLREFFVHRVEIPLADSVSIMAQLLDALAFAHERGVVHRDVKPANIMIMNDGRLKVADFGIARLDASQMTQVGSVVGTPSYMSPEQFLGRPADRRADLFSAGVVFYELLTSLKPFSGAAESVAYKICYEAATEPSKANPLLPGAFDAVMARALAKNPEERFQDAREFSEAIQEAYQGVPSPAVSEETIRTTVVLPRLIDPTMVRSERSAPITGTPSERSATPPGWAGETLKTLELQLATFVGPLARVLVRRAAHRTQRLDELVLNLAQNLSSEEERRTFLQRTGATRVESTANGTRNPSRGGSVVAGDSALTPETVERATGELAAYLGPIAKVLAKKAAQNARGRRAFYLLLADKLGTEEERRRFLARAGFP